MSTLKDLKEAIEEQINDEGLWFFAETAPEAYLQGELRDLHRVVEEYIKAEELK